MQAGPWASYSSYAAIVPSNTTPLNCRAIYVGGAGNLIIAPAVGGTQVTLAVLPGAIIPIELNQGIVAAASTATLLVALQ
jgi:hypothetical protein